jgi:hypothetical protein
VVDGGWLVEEDSGWGWSSSRRCGRWLELRDIGKRRGGDGVTLGWLGWWQEACIVVVDGEHNSMASGAVAGARAER